MCATERERMLLSKKTGFRTNFAYRLKHQLKQYTEFFFFRKVVVHFHLRTLVNSPCSHDHERRSASLRKSRVSQVLKWIYRYIVWFSRWSFASRNNCLSISLGKIPRKREKTNTNPYFHVYIFDFLVYPFRCQMCSLVCDTCSGGLANDCINCPTGAYYKNGTCTHECGLRYYEDSRLGECQRWADGTITRNPPSKDSCSVFFLPLRMNVSSLNPIPFSSFTPRIVGSAHNGSSRHYAGAWLRIDTRHANFSVLLRQNSKSWGHCTRRNTRSLRHL